MKKQLLTALLAFTPFFVAAKPTNAELLTHLKQVKTELENQLQEFATEEKIAQQEWEKVKKVKVDWNYYVMLISIWDDIADLPEHSHRRKILTNFYFDQIYKHKKSISEIAEMKKVVDAIVFVDILFSSNDKKQKKQEKILNVIIEKYANKYANDFYLKDLEDCYSLAIGIVIVHSRMVSIVLKKIDEKIKKLQKA